MANFDYGAALRAGYSKDQVDKYIQRKRDSGVGVSVINQTQDTKPSVLDRVANFLGVREFGKGMGQAFAQLSGDVKRANQSQEQLTNINNQLIKRALQKPVGDPERTKMLRQALGTSQGQSQAAGESTSDLVTNRQFIGSAATTALTVGTAGIAGKGKLLRDVAVGSGIGAGFGAADAVKDEHATIVDVLGRAGTGALVGAVFPTLAATKRGAGKLFSQTGKKIGTTVIKPTAGDISDGFKIDNVYKYNLGGNLNQTLTKTNERMGKLTNELNKAITSSDDKVVDLDLVAERTRKYFLEEQKLRGFGDTGSTKRVLNNLTAELDDLFPREQGISKEAQQAIMRIQKSVEKMGAGGDIGISGTMPSSAVAPNLRGLSEGAKREVQKYLDESMNSFGKDFPKLPNVGSGRTVNLYDATLIKRGAGTKGAWVFGSADPDATATQRVYTKFYHELKKEIERNAPENLSQINKEISELIPIERAVIRRIPVAERNNLLGLTDNIGLFASILDPRSLFLLGGKMLSTSGRVANVLQNIGGKLQQTSEGTGLRGVGRNLLLRATNQ